jgi:hypothetical protein
LAFNLRLSIALSTARWKVKIRDKETREHPHFTIIRGTKAWRINLRTGRFMDPTPDPSAVPSDLLKYVEGAAIWQQLCDAWDRLYPDNPVAGGEHDKE